MVEDNLTIWSPVLLTRLKQNRRIMEEKSYPLEFFYRGLEDLRIRIKERNVVALGTSIEARVKVDILCLLADSEGGMQLFKREETFTDRIPLLEFDRAVDRDDKIDYRLEIQGLTWEGEINGREVRVTCFIDYTVLATREQLVRLRGEERAELQGEVLSEAMQKLGIEIERIQAENDELRKQVFYHTRNISSLKKGLQKAENRNAALNRENTAYQAMIERMRQEIQNAAARGAVSTDRSGFGKVGPSGADLPNLPAAAEASANVKPDEANTSQLGARIKRLFQNSQ